MRWLETLDEEGIWVANRLTSGPATDGGRSRIPTLMVKDPITKQVVKEARTNEEAIIPRILSQKNSAFDE